ncbi:uncharacterized protein LOC127837260 isoform X2 [Dreissena polymorpha]|nr:uncharacterized protein LOC127837260 isoform X2 [Dreissena polymorpha]
MADHRKCEEVKVFADILHDITLESTGLKQVLHDLQQQGERLLEHEQKHEELVSEIESKALSSLQTIKQRLLDIYEQIKNNVLSAIADKKKIIQDKIKENTENLSQFLIDVKQQSTYFENVEQFGTNEHVVLLQRRLKKDAVSRLKSIVDELEKHKSKSSFKCIEDTSLDSLLLEIKNSLRIKNFTCDLSKTGSDTGNNHNKPYTERIPELKSGKDLTILPMFDKAKFPDPVSCTWIDKYIVIYLRPDNVLLVIEENSDFVLSKFKCHSSSWSVSRTGPTDMVISMPHAHKIAFAQLRYGNIHVLTELKTKAPYHYVTKNMSLNQYICITKDIGQIDLLNNDGTLLRDISLSLDLKECATSLHTFCSFNAYYLMLVFSQGKSDKLVALNLNGENIFEYKHPDLRSTGQLAVDPMGNMYVRSFNRKVHQISPSGQYIRSLSFKNESDYPIGICFNSTFDQIALIDYRGGNQYLRVYTFT